MGKSKQIDRWIPYRSHQTEETKKKIEEECCLPSIIRIHWMCHPSVIFPSLEITVSAQEIVRRDNDKKVYHVVSSGAVFRFRMQFESLIGRTKRMPKRCDVVLRGNVENTKIKGEKCNANEFLTLVRVYQHHSNVVDSIQLKIQYLYAWNLLRFSFFPLLIFVCKRHGRRDKTIADRQFDKSTITHT